ncbi:unnamed protein product [Mytilus coruscus]|uniref:Uncharacterized protein n=1 Tax=Mytilus coruscus TaxID=42192 RepID=A0A6J8BMA5_MYTCO|nr:unnamed protein product [Mytilus coruscus]
MKNVNKFANEDFEGLIINDDLVRFGSSRDGLKVNDALEFDCILLFDISGMKVSKELARFYSSEVVLGMMKLCVFNAEYLIRRFPWIEKNEIFKKFANGDPYFLRRTAKPPTFGINITLNEEEDITDLRDDIRSVQRVHMAIESDKKPRLDIDLVPALHLPNYCVSNPYTLKLSHGFGIEQMNCQVYAVMK